MIYLLAELRCMLGLLYRLSVCFTPLSLNTTSSAVYLASSVFTGSKAFFDHTQGTVLHLRYLPALTPIRHVFQQPEMLSV